jgi:4-amino-4-deoxy-L-arabinose transferase-like glycosyltransferase
MSGSVNPDSLLFAISAALFWSLALAFRRGLTYRRAIIIGAITVAGLLTKVQFVGLLPGVIVGLGVLAWRLARSSRSYAYRAFGLGAGIAAGPILPLAIVYLTRHTNILAGSGGPHRESVFDAISYIWQFYLPRLPGMTSYFPGVFTTRQVWFDGFVGRYGWGETPFPEWAYRLAELGGVAVLVACGRMLFVLRKTVRERLSELAVYAIMSAGLLVVIGGASYLSPETEAFTEARFLLPLLALLAAALGLAIRAAGRRREAVLGTIVVLAMIADNVFSQLLVVARYYG